MKFIRENFKNTSANQMSFEHKIKKLGFIFTRRK